MNVQETPVSFLCGEDRLYGVLHVPEKPAPQGLLIVVGGLQYRVGGHRQLLLLARCSAQAGIPVMRFDYRGMGDSQGEGQPVRLEEAHADIASAINTFMAQVSGLKEVAIWGLCSGASDALLYAPKDPRVTGVVLVNPWMLTGRDQARMRLKKLFTRLRSPASWSGLWTKLRRNHHQGATLLFSTLSAALKPPGNDNALESNPIWGFLKPQNTRRFGQLSDRMAHSLKSFSGRVLLILSGNDPIASEFCRITNESTQWKSLLSSKRVRRLELPEANHSFWRTEWRKEVESSTVAWLQAQTPIAADANEPDTKVSGDLLLRRKAGRFNAIRSWLQPEGLFIVVLGPDGSGKSTLIQQLIQDTSSSFNSNRVFHWRPGIIRQLTVSEHQVADPHSGVMRGSLLSAVHLGVVFLDYWLGYCFRIRPLLARPGLVVFDRHLDDLLVDPRRYRYGGPLWLVRAACSLVPRPDMEFILTTDPEVILMRKQELTLEEVQRQLQEFAQLARQSDQVYLLDAALPAHEVSANAAAAIRGFLVRRSSRNGRTSGKREAERGQPFQDESTLSHSEEGE